jgi:hypothetical protein
LDSLIQGITQRKIIIPENRRKRVFLFMIEHGWITCGGGAFVEHTAYIRDPLPITTKS